MAAKSLSTVVAEYKQEAAELKGRIAFFEGETARLSRRLDEVDAVLARLGGSTPAPAAAPEKRKPGRPPKSAASAPAAAAAAAAPAAEPKRRGRPPGSKNKPKPGAPPKAAKPARAAKAAKAPKAPKADGRRGRRSAVAATGIHALGIVEAAIAIAKQKGVRQADAGQVLEWFEEVGYKTRNGLPSRNSVYVSLNRESTEGSKKGSARVTRVDRGAFEFSLD